MDKCLEKREKTRWRRIKRVRKKLRKTKEIIRLSVHKTNGHIYVQLIDDNEGKTIAAIGTLSKESKEKKLAKKSKKAARFLGQRIAQMAKEKNIERVQFDRGRYKYHGLLACLADAAREAGLQF